MENGGNAKVNAIFEARLAQSPSRKPDNHADGPTRERFIRDKYERRKFYDPAAFHSSHVQQQVAPQAVSAPSVGPPSDAARQRIEARNSRNPQPPHRTSSESEPARVVRRTASTRSTSRRQIAQAPISAPVDLLDFSSDPPTQAAEDPFAAPRRTGSSSSRSPRTTPSRSKSSSSNRSRTGSSDGMPKQPERKSYSDDIMSLYQQQQPKVIGQPSQTMPNFPGYSNTMASMGGNRGGMMGGNNSMMNNNTMMMTNNNGNNMMGGSNSMMMNNGNMMGGSNNSMMNNGNNMAAMNNMMQNMNLQQRQGMMNQQGMMMNPQQMMQQQQQMMMQQQQMMQQNRMMQQPGYGMNLSLNTGTGGIPPPEKEDPFAQFGSNVFRS